MNLRQKNCFDNHNTTQTLLTILKALSHGHIESIIGSMPMSFLMASPGVIALGAFDMIRYWLSSYSFSGRQQAASNKKRSFGST